LAPAEFHRTKIFLNVASVDATPHRTRLNVIKKLSTQGLQPEPGNGCEPAALALKLHGMDASFPEVSRPATDAKTPQKVWCDAAGADHR
jgi:hypothetical protein